VLLWTLAASVSWSIALSFLTQGVIFSDNDGGVMIVVSADWRVGTVEATVEGVRTDETTLGDETMLEGSRDQRDSMVSTPVKSLRSLTTLGAYPTATPWPEKTIGAAAAAVALCCKRAACDCAICWLYPSPPPPPKKLGANGRGGGGGAAAAAVFLGRRRRRTGAGGARTTLTVWVTRWDCFVVTGMFSYL
jgi:hypothetical protein